MTRGSISIVLNAPEERSVGGVKELWVMAMQPGFVVYATFVVAAGTAIHPFTRSPVHPFTRSPVHASVKSRPPSLVCVHARFNPLASHQCPTTV